MIARGKIFSENDLKPARYKSSLAASVVRTHAGTAIRKLTTETLARTAVSLQSSKRVLRKLNDFKNKNIKIIWNSNISTIAKLIIGVLRLLSIGCPRQILTSD